MIKRIGLFILTNIAFVMTIGLVFAVLKYFFPVLFSDYGYFSTLAFAAVLGFSSAILSLLGSKFMAKLFVKPKMIKENHYDSNIEKRIYEMVKNHSTILGFDMPEVGIYDNEQPNAFATGYSRNKSLVAISTGLINLMNMDEIEAVICHELAHIKNGDMITMTLLTGVVDTFVIFFTHVLRDFLVKVLNESDNPLGALAFFVIHFTLNIVLSLLTYPIIAAFSRYREYHADKGSAELIGKYKMISALQKLERYVEMEKESKRSEQLVDGLAAFGITPTKTNWITSLFSTHPSFENRIKALENM